MIYFDNAATTFPKPHSVIKATSKCIKEYCGNPGRGSHILSQKSAEAVYDTREKIAHLLNVEKAENVVFTHNATYALNLAIKTNITKNCHVLTSDIEHNSVVRPLEKLKQTLGIEYSFFETDGDIESNIKKIIRKDTYCIVSTLASNVTGKTIPINILSKISREYGIKLIVDASQYIGHNEIDLTKTPCDVFCAPGHKSLFGIQGCGFAYFLDSKIKESFIEGGSGTDSKSLFMPEFLPEGYEAGTLSTPSIVSLGAGIDYIDSIKILNIASKLRELSSFLKEELKKINYVILYPSFDGIVAFNHKHHYSNRLSELLNEHKICVRAGLHCAPSAHKKLGTLDYGCVRVSFSYLNTINEVEAFISAIKYLK